MMRIYDMSGARKIEKYYSESNTINADLSTMVPGFYVAMILSEEGRIYGLKLYR